jgi:four helix bundle suffix protein
VQAARSGVQSIAEGSQASGTSKKSELKLTSVARGSLEELRLGYEDYLRLRRLLQWETKDPRRQHLIDRRCTTADQLAQWVKEIRESSGPRGQSGLCGSSTQSTTSTPSTYPEIAANAALVLIAVACGLLDRQLAALSEAFEQEGGFTERLYQRRQQARKRQ